MIAQLLNRKFILNQLESVEFQLRKRVEGGAEIEPSGEDDLSRDDYGEALALVRGTQTNEAKTPSGQIGFDPLPTGRRGEKASPLEDVSFFSRDPIINILQSALEQYFEERAKTQKERIEVIAASTGRRDSALLPAVTDRFLPGVQPTRDLPERRLFNKFEIADPGWFSSAVARGIRVLRRKHPFNEKTPQPLEIADRSRLLLVGDWASGLPRAQRVASEMRKYIEEGKQENREVHVFHLGDTYYSGWEREYRKRFIPYWPVRSEEAASVGSWCLNANHDMYSGGHAYYKYLLADARFERQGGSSYFELFNCHWQILSLDTAWASNRLVWDYGVLAEPQAEWVARRTKESNRKVMLLSHHQLFSSYDSGSEVMRDDLGEMLNGRGIDAWFWGHEHRCMIFKPYWGVQFASCIGHGGVPVYMSHDEEKEDYPEPGAYEYRGYIKRRIVGGIAELWSLFGFAVLDFEGPHINVRYVNELGKVHKEAKIE